MIKNKKILILGAARSGIAAAKLVGRDNEVILTDLKELSIENNKILNDYNVEVIITDKQEDVIDETFDIVIKNPGVPLDNPVLVFANNNGIDVINEVEVAYNYIPKETFIIGITGSNGKTTTTTITYELLKRSGKNVLIGGNIGIPLCDLIPNITKDSILVLEISDHQLLNMKKFKTNISLLTNICPTHLDFHGTYDNYKKVKRKIFNNHNESDLAIINNSNSDSINLTKDIISNKIYFNSEENYIDEKAIYVNKELIINLEDIKVVGIHNYENILSALMIMNYFGINKEVVKSYLSEFNGVEHRIEYVTEQNGIKYYNDSKATNPTSTITALNTFKGNVHLVLGGMERSQDFNELNECINKIKYIYAVGETTERIHEYAKEKNIECYKCNTLQTAVKNIKENSNLLPGDIVLLSPASASWDQYAKFEDRGNEFKKLVIEK